VPDERRVKPPLAREIFSSTSPPPQFAYRRQGGLFGNYINVPDISFVDWRRRRILNAKQIRFIRREAYSLIH